MTEDELNSINNSIKEKVGEEAFATISDDIGKIITGRESMEKDIKDRDSTISTLEEKNRRLVDANANLFKQIPKSSDSEAPKEETEVKHISIFDAFDKSGNFKH